MKPTNLEGVGSHAQAIIRGWIDQGLTFRSGTTTAIDVRDLNIIGGTLTSNGDGTWTLTIGGADGTPGSGGGATGSSPVNMLNSSARDLLPGDVVVVDGDTNTAVTTTTTAGDTRIAGVVQEPIAIGAIGPVVFNGYTPVINSPTAVRGEYAKTSTTEVQADSTSDRQAGSFAVYVTGTDFPDFISASAVTEQPTPVETLSITMPPVIPIDRTLFLALWLIDDVTAVDVPGWTLIGAEAGFNYYTRISTGDDAATATWTGVSVAVAIACMLHPAVSLAVPLEDHDYEDTTTAAALSGLADVAHYALAGVRAEVLSPSSGFAYLGSGTAEFEAAGTPALVQSKEDFLGTSPGTLSFDSTLTGGNLMLSVAFAEGLHAWSTDPRQGGTCPIDANMVSLVDGDTNLFASGGRNSLRIMGKTVDPGDTYSGPFGSASGCESSHTELLLLEFANAGITDYEIASLEGTDTSPIDLGTFTVGPNDLLIMAAVAKVDGYGGSPDPAIGVNGFTQLLDQSDLVNGWEWAGYKIGDGDASITYTSIGGGWAAVAVLLRGGTQTIAGTLAGKYIGHDAAVTSPFSGAGKEDDAIFAVNLLLDAKPSALLYGPDLGDTGTPFSGDAADVNIADSGGYFTGTNVEDVLAELASKDIGYQAHGNMGSTETFSALTGWHSGTFDDDCTFTFSGATSGIVASIVLELTEDGTGGWQPTWPGSVVWPGGTPPTHDDTLGTTTLYLFESRDGGTTWYGFQAGSPGSTVAALDDLTDVTITTPAEDDDLRYNGSVWVNDARKWEAVTDGEDVFVWVGDDLVHDWSVP